MVIYYRASCRCLSTQAGIQTGLLSKQSRAEGLHMATSWPQALECGWLLLHLHRLASITNKLLSLSLWEKMAICTSPPVHYLESTMIHALKSSFTFCMVPPKKEKENLLKWKKKQNTSFRTSLTHTYQKKVLLSSCNGLNAGLSLYNLYKCGPVASTGCNDLLSSPEQKLEIH